MLRVVGVVGALRVERHVVTSVLVGVGRGSLRQFPLLENPQRPVKPMHARASAEPTNEPMPPVSAQGDPVPESFRMERWLANKGNPLTT